MIGTGSYVENKIRPAEKPLSGLERYSKEIKTKIGDISCEKS